MKQIAIPFSFFLLFVAILVFAASLLFAERTRRQDAARPREPILHPITITETNAAEIAADIESMTGGGTLILPNNITGHPVGTIFVTHANITVQCYPGTVVSVTGTPSANMWQVQASGFVMEGCTMDYTGGKGSTMFIGSGTGVSDTAIRHTRFIGGPLRFGQKVRDLQVDDFTGTYIQGDNDGVGIRITNSFLTFSGLVSGIQLHSSSTTQKIAKVTITNNHLFNAGGVFCVEIGAFSATLPNPLPSIPTDITVANNQCTATKSPVAGGYSFAPTLRTTVTGNIYDGNGMHADIAAIELTYGDGAVVSGNTVKGAGVSLDTQSRTMVVDNLLRTIYVGTSSNFGTHDTSDNVIQGNVFDCSDCRPGGYPSGEHVIYIENNAVGSRVQRTRVLNNRILGGAQRPDGILIINNAQGTADAEAAGGTIIGGNYFESLASCVWPGHGSGTFHLADGNDFSGGCTQQVIDNSANRAQQGDYQRYTGVAGTPTYRAGKRHTTTIRSVLSGNVTRVLPTGFSPGDQLVAIFCQPGSGTLPRYSVNMGPSFVSSPAMPTGYNACVSTTYTNDGGLFR